MELRPSMLIVQLVCERERFKIDSVVRQDCIMSPWLFNIYVDAMMKEVKMGMGRRGENKDYLASCILCALFTFLTRSSLLSDL